MQLAGSVLLEIAGELERRDRSLRVVAQGYRTGYRDSGGTVASHLHDQLAAAGFIDRPERRVIAESYSRFIRGVSPLRMEHELVFLRCQLLLEAFACGDSRIIPYSTGEHELGARALDDVRPDNTVEAAYLGMIERVGLPMG